MGWWTERLKAESCAALRVDGRPCRRRVRHPSGRCGQHRRASGELAGSSGTQLQAATIVEQAAANDPLDASPTARATGDRGAAATAEAGGGTLWSAAAHPNDRVVAPDHVDLDRLAHLRGERVVTVDLDGTCYDPWACCGYEGRDLDSDPDCRHLREEVVAQIREVCDREDAVPVVLSWRAGRTERSRRWLDQVGFDREAEFIPGSWDDIAGLRLAYTDQGRVDHAANRQRWGGGQLAYKAATVQALQDELGCEVVAGFDDNPHVVAMLADVGVAEPVQVPHLVEIQPWERQAGYLGAPKPVSSDARSQHGAACIGCGAAFDGANVRHSRRTGLCVDCAVSAHSDGHADAGGSARLARPLVPPAGGLVDAGPSADEPAAAAWAPVEIGDPADWDGTEVTVFDVDAGQAAVTVHATGATEYVDVAALTPIASD